MINFTYVPDQGNFNSVDKLRLEWYQGVNNFFTRGGYRDLYNRSQGTPVAAYTANTTLTASNYNNIIVNTGASADENLILPPAVPGYEIRFRVVAAHYMAVYANGSDTIEGTTAGHAIRSNTPVSLIHLTCCVSGLWDIETVKGTWTYL